MTSKVHTFTVEMTCEGCSKALDKVLTKNRDNGIESFRIDLPSQLVQVSSALSANEVLEIIKKTGKKTEYVKSE